MKQKILITILIATFVFSITGCGNKKGLIKDINIEEGCYVSLKDKDHLICFTKEHNYYSILNKYNTYYNDINYYVPPEDDSSYGKYNFSFTYEKNSISLKVNNDDFELLTKCSVQDSKTLNCTLESNSENEITSEYRIYNKVDKEFNEEIIKKLPIFNRTKEYNINFNGEIISCNLTWLYSVINTAAGTSTIKQCLEKEYNEEFIIGIPTDSQTKWLIKSNSQKIAFDKKFPGATPFSSNFEQAMKYNNENFGYDVTASIGKSEEIAFGIYDAFPYDPYDEKYNNEKMTVKITNKANTHVTTIPEPSKLQYNKKYGVEAFDNPYHSYFKFIDSKTVEHGYDDFGPWTYSYELYDNLIVIKCGWPEEDITCNILSDTIIHCSDSPYNDYIIH